ncbi:hypothetical protein HK100_000438 [Physocladia obscura]|uniref:Uncharacterized protein n=1 Tax=Physocladia obscura TaxID=109957 RepID=A0AAD5TDU3_9FUNG|nr:hypothetical protein HK100_000438 [Physocladia obscura]
MKKWLKATVATQRSKERVVIRHSPNDWLGLDPEIERILFDPRPPQQASNSHSSSNNISNGADGPNGTASAGAGSVTPTPPSPLSPIQQANESASDCSDSGSGSGSDNESDPEAQSPKLQSTQHSQETRKEKDEERKDSAIGLFDVDLECAPVLGGVSVGMVGYESQGGAITTNKDNPTATNGPITIPPPPYGYSHTQAQPRTHVNTNTDTLSHTVLLSAPPPPTALARNTLSALERAFGSHLLHIALYDGLDDYPLYESDTEYLSECHQAVPKTAY